VGHWHRRPKKLSLKRLFRDAECEFVFDGSQTSVDEFLELRAILSSMGAPQQLLFEMKITAGAKRILIVSEDQIHLEPSARLGEGWRGVIIVPTDCEKRREVLTIFFMQQLRYRIAQPYDFMQGSKEIPPFFLDLRTTPATLTSDSRLFSKGFQ
jgi:hypothetical protein